MDRIYRLPELIDILSSSHRPNKFYRGQISQYNWPLWPSMYRGFSRSEIFQIKSIPSQYRRGEYFAFRSVYMFDERAKSKDFMRQRDLKKLMMGHIRNALGFCLAEAMFQQAGWSSQGLDVTSDYNVALFFATHKFCKGEYIIDNDEDNIHLLYIWDIPPQEWSLECLNHHDYYSLPIVFPTNKILDLFEECDTIDEHLFSIKQYREFLGWNSIEFDLGSIRTCRPYKIIKIPRSLKIESRIAKQSAGLLFPDFIDIEVIRPYVADENIIDLMKAGGQFLEDLSTSNGCKYYLFKANRSEIENCVEQIPSIYASTDISHIILKDWMKSFYNNMYGTPTIVIPNMDYISQVNASLNFDNLRYEDYGKNYNQ